MAVKKKGSDKFSGLIGSVVLRDDDGVQIVQTKPATVRQTEETKKSSDRFGKASRLANIIRKSCSGCYDFTDRHMVNRYTTVTRDILADCFDKKSNIYTIAPDSFSRLVGLEFNDKSKLVNNLLAKITAELKDSKLIVDIPELAIPGQLKFPAGVTHCRPKLAICQISLLTGKQKREYFETAEINNVKGIFPAQQFVVNAPKGTLVVVALGLKYYSIYRDIKTAFNTKEFDPAGICVALANPGISTSEELKSWKFIVDLAFPNLVFTTSLTAADLPNSDVVQATPTEDVMIVSEKLQNREVEAEKEDKVIKIALKLKSMGLSQAEIAEAVDLSIQEVEGILIT